MILVSRMTAFWPWNPIADGHFLPSTCLGQQFYGWLTYWPCIVMEEYMVSSCFGLRSWNGIPYIVYDLLCDKFRSTWADRIQQTNITVPQLANLHQWQPQSMKTHLTLGPQYMHSNPNKNRKVNSYSPTEIVMNCCSIFFPHVLGQFLQGDLNICHDDPTQWFV